MGCKDQRVATVRDQNVQRGQERGKLVQEVPMKLKACEADAFQPLTELPSHRPSLAGQCRKSELFSVTV